MKADLGNNYTCCIPFPFLPFLPFLPSLPSFPNPMDSFILSKHEVILNGTKYLHRNGKLFTIRDRESDADYSADEDWTFTAWCGPEADPAAQLLFDEGIAKQKLAPLRTPVGDWSRSQKAKTAANKLIKWLKENPHHSQHEYILRALISYHPSMWKIMVTEGIALLPPQAESPHTAYDKELIEYIHAYTANPRRSATHEEIVNILEHTLHTTSYPTRVFPILNAAGFTAGHLSHRKTLNGISYVTLVTNYTVGRHGTCGVACIQDTNASVMKSSSSVFCPIHGRFVRV